MKRFFYPAILLCMIVPLFSCLSDNGRTQNEDSSPTGRLVIYTSMYPDVIEQLDWALQRQFPRARIEFVYGGTGEIQARIAAEHASGKLGADILLVAEPSYSLELKSKRMLHSFTSRSAPALAFDFDEEGYWYPVRISNMVLAFNPRLNNRSSLPNSFYDFAHSPNVRGSISMSNPLTSGTTKAAVTALRDRYGYEYFEALGRQNVSIQSGALALDKLENGEFKVIMVLEESVLQRRSQERSDLEIIYPTDGTIIIPSTIMIVANRLSANNNTRSAERVVDWFLAPDGQNAIVDGWMHSVRRNFRSTPAGSVPMNRLEANSMPFNWENSFRYRNEILAKFEELVLYRQ